ncbi:carboxylic acid reductase [Actinokineospora iranica]|uniref:Carboxylic acid reductase n=1 Tax=Actinokineospora iranica TaxID=1271860 RepID=A0A1G6PJB6_9PSEU|nr:carboxylic acid reductase [Actinokineospora iranica]SDC79616.1 fatty acid CoA ligase FadD9 [Actinokineospora iranica]
MTTGTGHEYDDAGWLADPRARRRLAELLTDDPQVRDVKPDDAVRAAVRRPGMGLAEIVATIMAGYADRPALGERATEPVVSPDTGRTSLRLLPRFDTITYRELWARVRAVAAEWHHHPEHPLRAGEFVAILGFASSDYATLDLACVHLGVVSVPLHASASVAQLEPIIAETGPRVLAASVERLDTAVDLALTGPTVRRVIVFDFHAEVDDEREAVESARGRLADAGSPVVIDTLAAVLDRGAASPAAPLFAGEDEDLSLLLYTSGSTGTPKGAVYPQRLVADLWSGATSVWPETVPLIGVIYLPLSHIAGRVVLVESIARGGTAYFTARSDLSCLFEDIALVRPTLLILVPRVCDMLFQRYRAELDRRGAESEEAVAAEVREVFRRAELGGRVVASMCGSAPLSADVAAFVESVLEVNLRDGYGSTEAGVLMLDSRLLRPPVTDHKLADVPELGYFRTDVPHPRGELLVKAATVIPGYYRRPEVTADIFDEDGYYRTGDIMAQTGPDQLVYVDRRSNVLKLSQGEFVAVSRLEALFVTSPLIQQIFVYGNSERAYLLAVIVPTPAATDQGAELKRSLTESVRQVARDAGLSSYEIPRDFLVETEPFSAKNGLLSDARKLLRPRLLQRYGDRLEQLYTDLADGQDDELRLLREGSADRPVLDTVSGAARALLGARGAAVADSAHFLDLGGDSLSALTFSNLLGEIFGVEVPVGVVISPANTLRNLAAYIEAERRDGASKPTFASVHGQDSVDVRAGDLTLDKFIDTDTLTAAPTLPSAGDPRTVLLTGANGYLGRFLCLEWLRRLAPVGGRLICVLRGSSADAARQRLDEAFDSDSGLAAEYKELAEQALEVVAGDIGEPNLGLDAPTWQRLTAAVDLIVHSAALVNHVLPYTQLFGPNVAGTAEVIRLAITTRRKPVTYVSTVGVAAQVGPAALAEDADIRSTSPTRRIADDYANGYAISKWAGEVLLREAHDLCGLPVAVFRSDMILAHTRYTRQLNVPDMFTRLLLSLVLTGVAPHSFYETTPDGARQRAHYDGLPVDFTAEAITTLGAGEGFRTFNTLNPHDDGISLDTFVDWLIDAGHPIHRITDYQEWLDRFDSALRALPEKQRQHSLLPLLQAFTDPAPATPGSAIPTTHFEAAVRTAEIGPDHDIPHLAPPLISKYLNDLQELDLLPAP